MNKLLLSLLALAACCCAAGRAVVALDFDWRFTLGDPAGAQTPAFDDSAWRALDVPHDWAIETPVKAAAAQTEKGGYKPLRHHGQRSGARRRVDRERAPGRRSSVLAGSAACPPTARFPTAVSLSLSTGA